MRFHLKVRSAVLTAAALGSLAPLQLSPAGRLEAAQACADGTCCSETGSDCIINDIRTSNAYRLAGGGSCPKGPTPIRP